MTVGVKIVQLTTGTAAQFVDCGGATPVAVLFFGGYADSNGASRFYGASDGTNQWCANDFRRTNMSAFFSPTQRMALSGRNDVAVQFMTGAPGSLARDTYASVDSFSPNTINFTWHNGAAAGTTFTAVVFYGAQWQAQVGTTTATGGGGTKVTTPWAPGCVFNCIMASTSAPKTIAFGTSAPNIGQGINNSMSFGWGTNPEPDFDPATGANGTTNTTTFGQQNIFSTTYAGSGMGWITGESVQNPAGYGVNDMHFTWQSDGFTLIEVAAPGTYVADGVAYLALNWTGGRFVSGYMKPTTGMTGASFTKWGGTYNGSNVDTDPSNHAEPSFVLVQGMAAFNSGWGGANSHSYSIGAFDEALAPMGYAYGGFTSGLPSMPLSPPCTELVNNFSSAFNISDPSGGALTQMAITSLDDDGITVTFPVPPVRDMGWPYIAFGKDVVVPDNTANMNVTEPRDKGLQRLTSDGTPDDTDPIVVVLPDNTRTNPTVREFRDILSFNMSTKLGVNTAVTELRDILKFSFMGSVGFPIYRPGDVNYRREEVRIFRGQVSSPFIREGELGFDRGHEERLFRRPAEIKTFNAPPVESGPWV